MTVSVSAGIGPLRPHCPWGAARLLILLLAVCIAIPGFAQEESNTDLDDLFADDRPASNSDQAAADDDATTDPEPADSDGLAVISLPEEDTEAEAPPRIQGLEEIIVTASKRESGSRDLAGSVAAIGGEQLERIQAQGMEDYLKLVPGVVLAEQDVDSSIPIIRGIATDSTAGFTPLTTGIYLDDMPFQDLFIPISVPNLHPFDLERVEVLKGPQGTLFGSGALAGAIRYIVNKPVFGEFGGKLQYTRSTSAEGTPGEVLAAAINVPIGERFAVRGLGLTRETPGHYDVRVEDAVTGALIRDDQDVNRGEQDSFRVLAGWDIAERLSLSLMHFAQDSAQQDFFGYADQRRRFARDDQVFPSPRESRFGGTNLGARYQHDAFDLLYSGNVLDKSTFSTLHQEGALGIGQQNLVEAPNTTAGQVDGITHELRVSSPAGSASPWTWLGGISRLDYSLFFFQYFAVLPTLNGEPSTPPRGPDEVSRAERISSQLFAIIDSEAYENSLFGEATRLFGQRWELTLGLRAYQTRLDADTVLSGAQIVALSGEEESRNSHRIESDGLNPKLSLRFLQSEAMQFFGLIAKGFQFGGIQLNPPVLAFTQAAEANGYEFAPYDSSTLWNYELGFRSEWFDKRLRFDATLFYMDWSDLQLTVQVPVVPANPLTPPVGFGLIANVGKAHSQGLELALDALPWPFLRLTSSAAFIEAETDVAFDEDHPDGPVPPGTQLPGGPSFQWSNVLSLNFDLPFVRHWKADLSLSHTHLGDYPDQIRPLEIVGGYDTFDLRATVAQYADGFAPSLTVGLTNLTDQRGVASQLGVEGLPQFLFTAPRTLRVTLEMSF